MLKCLSDLPKALLLKTHTSEDRLDQFLCINMCLSIINLWNIKDTFTRSSSNLKTFWTLLSNKETQPQKQPFSGIPQIKRFEKFCKFTKTHQKTPSQGSFCESLKNFQYKTFVEHFWALACKDIGECRSLF